MTGNLTNDNDWKNSRIFGIMKEPTYNTLIPFNRIESFFDDLRNLCI